MLFTNLCAFAAIIVLLVIVNINEKELDELTVSVRRMNQVVENTTKRLEVAEAKLDKLLSE